MVRNMKQELFKMTVVGLVCGCIYVTLEVFHHGSSHWSMFLLAAVVSMSIDMLDEALPKITLMVEAVISTVISTFGEGVVGLIVNKDYSIWDYRGLYGSFFYDQCNMFFVLVWFLLSFVAIFTGNFVRHKIFNEPKHKYRWF